MKKFLFGLIIIPGIAAVAFFVWTAILAKKESADILSKFKDVNNSLATSIDTLNTNDRPGKIQSQYQISSVKSELIILIDSIKEAYESTGTVESIAKKQTELQPAILRLLHDLQAFNKMKWDAADSAIPDTIQYWPGSNKFIEQKWQSEYFDKNPKEIAITYLNYLRNQALIAN